MSTSDSSVKAGTDFYEGSNQHPYASVTLGNNGVFTDRVIPTMNQMWEALIRVINCVNKLKKKFEGFSVGEPIESG